MISENIFLNILCSLLDINRDGSLEVPQAKATRYNDNVFGKEPISLPERDQLNITIISLV